MSLSVNCQQAEAQGGQGNAESQESPANLSPWALPVYIVEDEADAEARQAREERAEQRERDDLAAQQGMDEATRRMAEYSKWQTILVGIGTALLIGTLYLTGQANRAAVRAAKAADDTVAITRDLGEAQIRAYLFCRSAKYKRYKDYLMAIVEISNTGQSPASNVTLSGTVLIHTVGGFRAMPRVLGWVRSEKVTVPCQPIVANGSIVEEIGFHWGVDILTDEESDITWARSIFDDGNEVWFDLEIKWRDVFGQHHVMPVYLSAEIAATPRSPRKKRSNAGILSSRMDDMRHGVPDTDKEEQS